ncbi:MAG: arginase family protein [Butyrivibrio sp.]|jgi:arginase family enzyme|nr:arginase family protein [Butyrivibrio sp.]MCR4637037.1 arginase family protein [Butyrivibrio sp.]
MNKFDDVAIFNFTGVYESEDFYRSIDNPRFIECKDISGTDCFCDDDGERTIRNIIEGEKVPLRGIHFIDNGNYHYMSHIFTSMIEEPFDLIYFDNHPDMKPSMFGDILSCGSWVKKVIETNVNVRNVIAVGINKELFDEIDDVVRKKVTLVSICDSVSGIENDVHKSLDYDNINFGDGTKNFDNTLNRIMDELSYDLPVYISVDKDVLSPDQLKTNWDQGTMLADTLLEIIKRLVGSKKVLGIDICGEVSIDTDFDYDLEIQKNNSFNKRILTELS